MIINEEQINLQFLTNLLWNQKVLPQFNCITKIQKNIKNSEGSLTYSYLLTYRENNRELPQAIYVKFDKIRASTHYKNLTRNEIDFYQNIGSICKDFIVGMYEGAYSEQLSYLLLEDYSNTHYVSPYETDIKFYNIAARRIAEFHHYCSTDRLTYIKSFDYCPMSYNAVDIRLIKANHQEFTKLLNGYLSMDEITLLEQAISHMELKLDDINRYLQSNQNTIIHGDFHLMNCLFHMKNEEHDMRIIDWQWWGYGIGTYDIAHLLNLYLPTKLKSQELTILKTYYDHLVCLGTMLTWGECILQYQLFTMMNLFKPAHYAIHCKLRRKKIFWKEFLDNIIISYKSNVINK